MSASSLRTALETGKLDEAFRRIYVCGQENVHHYVQRALQAVDRFEELYGKDRELFLFSAPGRTEVGGNHTDHQHGRVLAAGVNLDVIAVAAKNPDQRIRVKSQGHAENVVDGSDIQIHPQEEGTSNALIRGICACFREMGKEVGGFDAYTTSDVLTGSGLSSSAAFEVLIGTIFNGLYCENSVSPLKIAQIGQKAENVYFGKPCGLMDQAASSIGGFITIDFEDKENPKVEQVDFDFAQCGYDLCIVDTRGDHADLTPDYAAIPQEMKSVAAVFGKEFLREVDPEEFYRNLPLVREKTGGRAVMRAIHFFQDNQRVPLQVEALCQGDFDTFRKLVIASGNSSAMYLQNVFSSSHPQRQEVSLALALCQKLLESKNGAWRVHGGGFAGTVQAFVPCGFTEEFSKAMEAVFGEGSCYRLSVRPVGGIQLF